MATSPACVLIYFARGAQTDAIKGERAKVTIADVIDHANGRAEVCLMVGIHQVCISDVLPHTRGSFPAPIIRKYDKESQDCSIDCCIECRSQS